MPVSIAIEAIGQLGQAFMELAPENDTIGGGRRLRDLSKASDVLLAQLPIAMNGPNQAQVETALRGSEAYEHANGTQLSALGFNNNLPLRHSTLWWLIPILELPDQGNGGGNQSVATCRRN